MIHYEFTGETMIHKGVKLNRIRSTMATEHTLSSGELGGWIEKYENLKDGAWVQNEAKVYGNAVVCESAHIYENAEVYENAKVSGYTWVLGNCHVRGNVHLSDDIHHYGEYYTLNNETKFR